MMPCRAVLVWRDVKHSTSTWRGGGKNTHGQSEEIPQGSSKGGRHSES